MSYLIRIKLECLKLLFLYYMYVIRHGRLGVGMTNTQPLPAASCKYNFHVLAALSWIGIAGGEHARVSQHHHPLLLLVSVFLSSPSVGALHEERSHAVPLLSSVALSCRVSASHALNRRLFVSHLLMIHTPSLFQKCCIKLI